MQTCVSYTPEGGVAVFYQGHCVATLELSQVCALDSDLRDTCQHAMEMPGTLIPVPTKTFAKGIKARNYGSMGVRQ